MRSGLPVYVPHMIASGTTYEGPTAGEYPRAYELHDPHGNPASGLPDRARVQRDARPVLRGAGHHLASRRRSSRARRRSASSRGKRLELHFDGSKLRLVAWRTPQAVYWVSNTLSLDLTNQQMLGMAASLTRAQLTSGALDRGVPLACLLRWAPANANRSP